MREFDGIKTLLNCIKTHIKDDILCEFGPRLLNNVMVDSGK